MFTADLNSFEDAIPKEMLILNLWPHRIIQHLICAQLSEGGGQTHPLHEATAPNQSRRELLWDTTATKNRVL